MSRNKVFISLHLLCLMIAPLCFSETTKDLILLSEVNDFFDQYLKHYNRFIDNKTDQQALDMASNDIGLPAIHLTPGGQVVVFDDPESVTNNTATFLNRLRKNAMSQIVWSQKNIRILTPNSAIASNVANILDAEQNDKQRITATYLLHKQNQQWRIVVRTIHPNNALPLTFKP